jgi:hypothetical protein
MKETVKAKMIRVIGQLKNIEKWKGDAYSQDDEVDQAMTELKMIALNTIYGYPNEVCPHCENQSVINRPFSPCPKCGKILVACTMCSVPDSKDSCKGCREGSKMRIDIDFDLEKEFRLAGGGK